MQHVRVRPDEAAHLLRMLERAYREAQSTAVDAARARVEGLLEPVAVGRGTVPKRNGAVTRSTVTSPRECRRELVVVRWSEGRWISVTTHRADRT